MKTEWPHGSSEMAERIRTYDWASTLLGPAGSWPDRLKAVVEMMLDSPLVSSVALTADRLLLYNDTAARLYGTRHPVALGRPLRETFPDSYPAVAPLYDLVYAGESVEVQGQPLAVGTEGGGEVFDAYLTPVRAADGIIIGAHMVGLEIGKRARAQEALQESEKRQAFLLKLSDLLRPLRDPIEVMVRASEALGRHLGVGRCGYGEVDATGEFLIVERDWTDGNMASFRGRHRLVDFGPEFTAAYRAGRSVLINDALSDSRAKGAEAAFEAAGGVRASLGVPLTKDGYFVAGLFAQQISPRRWSAEEEALVREVGERTWEAVERARAEAALQESEGKYRTLFETIDEGFCIADRLPGELIDFRYVAANPAFERQSGLRNPVGHTMRELAPEIEEDMLARYARVTEGGGTESFSALGLDKEFHVEALATPHHGQIAVLFRDVTTARRAEETLRESEERQAFLLKLSDTLRPLEDPIEITGTVTRLLGEWLGASRAYYAEWPPGENYGEVALDYASPGLPSLTGRYPIDVFRSAYDRISQGRTWIVENAATDTEMNDAERRFYLDIGVTAWVDVPLVKRGQIQAALCIVQNDTRRWTEREIALTEETAERCWAALERARAEARLRESEERFAQFAASSSDGLWIRDAATLTMEYVSPAIEAIYGVPPESIRSYIERWAALIVPEDRAVALEHIKHAQQGESVVHEFRIQRPSDGAFRWIRNTDFPLHNNGRVQRIGGIAEDVTEVKLAFEHQGVLLAELQHRVRNIMAIIRSIVARTASGAEGVEHYTELLSGRLLTLARVQALLTRAANAGVSVVTIVQDELSAQASHADQFDVSGPEVVLSPKAAETMTLAVHELTSNALKYGALSVSEGKVTVRWAVLEKHGTPWLTFNWNETGAPAGPVASGPRRIGFGSELIQGRIPYELGGRGKVTIEPGGAQCHLEFPLKDGASVLETDAPKRVDVFGGAIDMAGAADLSGQRILVVEDDYYLANDTARALQGAGAEVIGPCPNEDAARDAIIDAPPTGAILDINLNGRRSFELARELNKQGIPFVFVTGYNQEVIPTEFEAVSRLQKPVEFRRIVSVLADSLSVKR